jgi:hypothetical protein
LKKRETEEAETVVGRYHTRGNLKGTSVGYNTHTKKNETNFLKLNLMLIKKIGKK